MPTLLNTSPGDVLSQQHICYFVDKLGNEYNLVEVVAVTYRHPSAPNEAIIVQLETHIVDRNVDLGLVCNTDVALLQLAQHNSRNCRKG